MIGLVLILLLIAINGLFVAMEFVIVGARLSRLESLSNRGGSIARKLDGPRAQDRYVAVAQLGITLASIGLGMYGEHKIAGWLEAPLDAVGVGGASVHFVAIILSVVILTYFHVVFGEMIPKALALKGAEPLLVGMWPTIRLFELLFRPLVWLLNVISQALLSLFGLNRTEARFYTPRELAAIAEDSSEGGAISAEQSEFIQNIVRLQGRRVDELMTPRRRVIALDLEVEDGTDLSSAILDAGPSRLPVVRGGLDTVLGVVHVKDVIRYLASERGALDEAALSELLRPLPKVLANLDTGALLDSMRQHATHMALVADENGSVLGAVAFEDAIEEVVGDMHSEFEVDEPDGQTRQGQAWKIPGATALSRLRETFELPLDGGDARTVAGLVIERLRRVPETGDTCTVDGLRLEVAGMDGLSITTIHARRERGGQGG